MNCHITICAKSEVFDLLSKSKYDAIISIDNVCNNRKFTDNKANTRRKQLAKYCEQVLHLRFYDVVDKNNIDGPKLYHIIRIKEFAETLRDKKVLIHCIAGISRSTAAAMIVLMCLDHGIDEARSHILKIRPIADPNQLMLDLYQRSLELDNLDVDFEFF